MQKPTVALVTGASRGIGRAIAQKLLDEHFYVIGTARQSAFPELFVQNDRFEGLRADLHQPEQLSNTIYPLFQRERAPGVLINNAGISEPADLSLDDDEWLSNWDKTMQVNLRAAALISKWAINRWTQEEGGVLINIASRAAYRGDTQEFSAYAASKGGMVAFTKSIARDFGRQGIAAYSIAPGFIKTDMAAEATDVYGEEYLTQGSAFDEITDPGEVAELAAFLATGKVKHMTGSTIHINGGSYML